LLVGEPQQVSFAAHAPPSIPNAPPSRNVSLAQPPPPPPLPPPLLTNGSNATRTITLTKAPESKPSISHHDERISLIFPPPPPPPLSPTRADLVVARTPGLLALKNEINVLPPPPPPLTSFVADVSSDNTLSPLAPPPPSSLWSPEPAVCTVLGAFVSLLWLM
jgi:hypothetical protein